MTAPRERVLFILPVEPWCRDSGSNLIMADLLQALSRSDEVDLLVVYLRRGPEGCAEGRPQGLAEVTIGVHGIAKWKSIVRSAITGAAPVQTRFDDRRVAAMVSEEVRKRGFRPTIIHVEHLPLVAIGASLRAEFGCPLAFRAHNIESLLWSRILGLPGALGRFVARRMARAEARAIESCDVTLEISDVDLQWARTHAPAARSELLPCSLLIDRYDAIPSTAPGPQPRIAFVGGLEWAPNEAGLRWFVHEVLPRVVERIPDVRLAVLARGADSRDWLTGNPNVDIMPAHLDARRHFAASDVSIAPLLEGGGVRIKIPESLALGCPVVATPIGGEGLELPGLTMAAEPSAFAAAVVDTLLAPADPERRARMRAAVARRHGADSIAGSLVALWRSSRPSRADGSGSGAPRRAHVSL